MYTKIDQSFTSSGSALPVQYHTVGCAWVCVGVPVCEAARAAHL